MPKYATVPHTPACRPRSLSPSKVPPECVTLSIRRDAALDTRRFIILGYHSVATNSVFEANLNLILIVHICQKKSKPRTDAVALNSDPSQFGRFYFHC